MRETANAARPIARQSSATATGRAGALRFDGQVSPDVVAGKRTGHSSNGTDDRADGDRLVRCRTQLWPNTERP